MSEWFWFVLKFPLVVFLILFIGAVFSDPSLLKVLIGIFCWPFSTAPEEDLLIKKNIDPSADCFPLLDWCRHRVVCMAEVGTV